MLETLLPAGFPEGGGLLFFTFGVSGADPRISEKASSCFSREVWVIPEKRQRGDGK